MGIIDHPNPVPMHQRAYQAAYNSHIRLWKINPRSQMILVPFQVAFYASLLGSVYMVGRKSLGYNTWFGKN